MDKNKFEYTYAAPTERERKEAEEIRKRYSSDEGEECGDKLERLKRLDEKAKRPPMIWALSLGIVGTIIFGGGMAMALEMGQYVWGTLVSVVGLAPVIAAYPVHRKLLKKYKDKYAEEILRLSDEILNGNKE